MGPSIGSVRAPLLLVALLASVACGDLGSTALSGATAAPVPTTVTVAPSLPVAGTTPASAPIALGGDAAAGVLSGGCLGQWEYDGRTGALTPVPQAAPSVRRSPSGRYVTEQRNVMAAGLIERTDLWIIDQAAGTERLLYSPPAVPGSGKGPTAQPNPSVAPYVFRRTENLGPWSPDERYLALWLVGLVSGSMDADGRPLAIIDVQTGVMTELGYTLLNNSVAWRAPHTLAYVAGGGRETWNNKTLRVWTPEAGSRALTTPDEVGIAPAWAPDGRLWFVRGISGAYDVPTYFAGRGIGDRSLVALDLVTGARAVMPRAPGYAAEGLRISGDGKLVLLQRRRLDPAAKAGTSPDSWVELWSARPDGSAGHPLVRLSAQNGFGYYGGYCSLATMEWRR